MSDPEYVIVGMPCTAVPNRFNSAKTLCTKCGTEMWLSPASQKKLMDGKGAVICLSCIPPKDEIGEIGVLENTLLEVANYRRRN